MTTENVTTGSAIAYARVSTSGQTLDQQIEKLTAAGAVKVFSDTASGARDDRPGLAECLKYLRTGDTLIVWRLDRLGRSMRHMVNTLADLTERGIMVRSISDGIDTSTSTGRMIAGVLSSIAEYEREMIQERILLKLAHSRSQGIVGGRRPKLTADQAALARRMRANGETANTICDALKISRSTLWRYLTDNGRHRPDDQIVGYQKASEAELADERRRIGAPPKAGGAS
jgi:DNA invertase Pin-like site-specific DNA recombinase